MILPKNYIQEKPKKQNIGKTRVVAGMLTLSAISYMYFMPPEIDTSRHGMVIPTRTAVDTNGPVKLTPLEISRITKVEEAPKSRGLEENKIVVALNKKLCGPLANKGDVYYDAGKQQGVNPMLMVAITMHETLYDGKYCNSPVLRNLNNVAGINWDGSKDIPHVGRYRNFTKGVDDSIYNMAYILNNFYIKEGRTSIDAIGRKFCPTTDTDNGKYGMINESWPGMVTKYYEQLMKSIRE